MKIKTFQLLVKKMVELMYQRIFLVRDLQTSNIQYGFEHIKLFNDINYLIYDPYASDSGHKRFVTILQDFHLYLITFDIQVIKFYYSMFFCL